MRHANDRRGKTRGYFSTVFMRGDFTSLLMAWALLVITALAVGAAHWSDSLQSLVVVSILSVGFGFLLARSHYSELLALILSSVYSIAAILVTNAYIQITSGPLWARTDELLHQVAVWIDEALAGDQPANDAATFVIFLSVLFWFLGHNIAWHTFRVNRVWRVILPTGLVLITNQFYYQGDKSLDIYLIAFVIVSLMLLIRSYIDIREYHWFVHHVSFPGYVRRAFLQTGGLLSVILVLIAWNAPTGKDDQDLERLQKLLSNDTVIEIAELWNRLFSSLEAQGIATADYYGGTELRLSGAIQLGDQPVMYVEVTGPPDARYYWRSTVYDTYDASSWRWQHIRTVRAFTDDLGLRLNIGSFPAGAKTAAQQTFTMLIRASRLVYAAPQPVTLGLPVEAELDCVTDFGRTCVNENEPADVAIIRARETLRTGDQYKITSLVSTASADMLRSAGQDYPEWVLRRYLQGANDVSPRVRDLAAQIVTQAGAVTAYDKARAIEIWLRTNIQYNESIPAPPQNGDPIEWFLFEQRQGYCNYYATAMVLMLRSQGIPARMAAGFAQGTWDAERNAFLVRERDAHTWVEVYFPDYGWVEFEPTTDEAPISRQDDRLPQALLPTVTPPPTLTPLPTATPTAIAPTDEFGAGATPTGPAESLFQPSTPTPTPVPSATPPPPPDVTHVGDGDNSNILRIVLLTLGIFALIVLGLVLWVLVVIWYIEYRGLGNLSTIQRAYARLSIYSSWIGLRFSESATPDERRRHLVGQLPEIEQPINTITHSYIEDRYAKPTREAATTTQGRLAQVAWQTARRTFIRRKIAQWLGREKPGP